MDKVNQLFDRRYLNLFKKWWLDIDKINFFLIIGIMAFGLVMIASSSPAIAKRIEVDKFFFLKKQLIFAVVALVMLVAISFLDQEKIKLLALAGLAGSILLLLLVLVHGVEIKGAKRWVSVL